MFYRLSGTEKDADALSLGVSRSRPLFSIPIGATGSLSAQPG